jgi:integrase
MATVRKQRLTRWVDAGGRRVTPGTAGAVKVTEESSKWYGWNVPGRKGPVPLATDRRVAEAMLAEMVLAHERGQAGLAPAESRRKSLPALVGEWGEALAAGGVAADARQKANRVLRLVRGCGWEHPAQIDPHQCRAWLSGLTFDRGGGDREAGPQTRNFYLEHTRAFCVWLVGRRLLPSDPLAGVAKWPVAADLRRARRSLAVDELARLLESARMSGHVTVRMSGADRWHLYQLACAVGFRRGELASLTPAHFRLDEDPPFLLLPGRRDKRRKGAKQPLPRDVADLFRAYLDGRPEAAPVWPRAVGVRAVHALRHDLAAAGIPYRTETPDGPVYCDFHSLRHTYVSRLEAAGLSLREAMQLARHSDPRLTMARYGRKEFGELAEKVQALGLPAAEGVTPAESLVAWLLVVAGLVAPPVVRGGESDRTTGSSSGPGTSRGWAA